MKDFNNEGACPLYSTSKLNGVHTTSSWKTSIAILTIVLLMFIVALILFLVYITYYNNICTSDPSTLHEQHLGIASDVIQCAGHHLGYRFSALKEIASDSLNDNPKGLPMDVFSLSKDDIQFHTYEDVHTNYQITLSNGGVNRFIMPYDYYNRPWYMWPDSTINMSINIVPAKTVEDAYVYLFKGERVINKFFDDNTKLPAFEEKANLLMTKSKSILWDVKKNDYYFVAVHLNAPKDTILQSNITFQFKYIDTDDYTWLPNSAKHINGVGESLKMGWSRSSNLTLCYLHPMNRNSLESSSIHIEASYVATSDVAASWMHIIIIPEASAPFFILCLIILLFAVLACMYTRIHDEESSM